eukprot:CAMPEP_0172169454 /NCGR_PEP_ID=MMETSP1050-20130122/10711_1 /TAXON_ID=233186 /ORGANISM="Cryptomonas curvata, Strain CCAP979/52" /LENGTH=45 /DNA_ID= /DNA_START= /DNA_END= /DNA_ORIENTATION=
MPSDTRQWDKGNVPVRCMPLLGCYGVQIGPQQGVTWEGGGGGVCE